MNLEKQVVVVTGSEGLLGKKIASMITENNGIAIRTDIKPLNEPNYYQMDINSKESIQACLSQIQSQFKKVNALINNAYPRNQHYGRKFESVELSDFNENVSIHLGGYFLVSQQFLQLFKEQQHGNIINIASIYGCVAPRFDIYEHTEMTIPVEYAVIKSAIIHLTKYIASYFKGNNIKCNVISPGGIFDHQPQEFIEKYTNHCFNKGMLDTDDITGALLFLLSNHSRFVNGQNIIVDDGFTL